MTKSEIFYAIFGPALLAISVWMFAVYLPRLKARIARAVRTQGTVEGFLANDPLGMPNIRFIDAQGQSVLATACNGPKSIKKGSQRTLANEHQRLTVGQQVDIRYDPDDPTWLSIDAFPPPDQVFRGLAWVLLGMGACLVLMLLL